ALDGQDYISVNGTLTWASGDVATKTFTVPILADGLVEGITPETAFLQLTNTTLNGVGTPDVLGTDQPATTLEITDSDHYGTFGFNASTYYANENSGGFVVTVVRTAGRAGTVSLLCTINNGGSTTVTNLSFAP